MCDDPVVLREAWHVLVHLRPAPVVARVTSGAPGVNPDDVVRELDVARHALRGGAPVLRPSDLVDPGPHVHDGLTFVFWTYVESPGELDVREAGEGLRAIHEALSDYEGELPRGGRPDEVDEMLASLPPSDDVQLLRDLSARPLPQGQALHGDSHLGNCMPGPVWHDLETACRGPREYDLAALMLSGRPEASLALEAYGDHDADLLEASLPVYGAWVCASFMVAAARRPDQAERVERELSFLRRYA